MVLVCNSADLMQQLRYAERSSAGAWSVISTVPSNPGWYVSSAPSLAVSGTGVMQLAVQMARPFNPFDGGTWVISWVRGGSPEWTPWMTPGPKAGAQFSATQKPVLMVNSAVDAAMNTMRLLVALKSDGFPEYSVGTGTAGSQAVTWGAWTTLSTPCGGSSVTQLAAPQCK